MPEGGSDCVNININIHINLSASSHQLPASSTLPLCSLFPLYSSANKISSSHFLSEIASSLLPFPISRQRWSRVMEMSHMLLWFLVVWWQSVLNPVLCDSDNNCLRAASLYCGLAGPAQPVNLHDDHWLT